MAFFLLVYDRAAGQLLRDQEYGRREDALAARFTAEDEFRDRDDIEIVALSAASHEELKRTHGRYFLGLDELAARLG